MTRAEWEITHARPMPIPKQLSIHLGWTQPCIQSGEVRGLRHTVGASHISTPTVPACKPSPNSLLWLHLYFFSLTPKPMIWLTHCLLVQPSVLSGGGSPRLHLQLLSPFLCQLSSHLYRQSTVQQHLLAFWYLWKWGSQRCSAKCSPSCLSLWIDNHLSSACHYCDGFLFNWHHHKAVNTGRDLSWSSRPNSPSPPLPCSKQGLVN